MIIDTKNKKNRGFTLIELSIVLVIIGFIIGSILIGQSLISSADSRALISQLNSYYAAVHTFKSRFNALPGDFAQATAYISNQTGSIINGDGNGLIASGIPSSKPTSIAQELSQFWLQLSALSLIDGSFNGATGYITLGTNYPYIKTNRVGIIAYGMTDLNNYYHLGLINNANNSRINTANDLTPQGAYEMDLKMDDGLPSSGILQARSGSALEIIPIAGASGSTGNCTATGTPITYNIAAPKGYYCQMRIQFQ